MDVIEIKVYSERDKIWEKFLIAVYCVKQTVKSVFESFVSEYENHFTYNRNLDEESTKDEFEFSANGSCLAYSSNVVEKAREIPLMRFLYPPPFLTT